MKKKIWGELYLDEEGKANFDCHIHNSLTFTEARDALEKFIALLQGTLDRRKDCPLCSENETHIHAASKR